MANQPLDEKIRALDYDPAQVIAFPGNNVKNLPPTKSYMKDNKYVVVKTEKHTMDGNYNPAILNAYMNVTYPGALVFADEELVNSTPSPLKTRRAPIEITVDLAGMEKSTVTVDDPEYGQVSGAVNSLLNQWLGDGDWSSASVQELLMEQVVDEKELSLKLGVDGKFLGQKLGIDFSTAKSKKRTYFVARFSEIFYTVSARLPVNPSDVFAPDYTWEDLETAGVTNERPPALVENVQYGQLVFIKFESDDESQKVSEALKAAVSAGGVSIETNQMSEYLDTLKKISYSAVSMGGNINLTNDGNMVNNLADLNLIIRGNTHFSKKSPGYPLYYKASFLKDNRPAVINGVTEYITTISEEHEGGILIIEHSGAYVAKFDADWDDETIDPDTGSVIVRHVTWDGSGKHRTSHYETVIPLKGNCRNIHVRAQGATGLAWEKWRTSVDTPPMALIPERRVEIWGTTLDQKHDITPQ